MKVKLLVIGMLIAIGGYVYLTSTVHDNYYQYAKQQQRKYKPSRTDYIIIIDYRKNIFRDRLYVIDMKTGNTVIKSKVSHAWESGVLHPNEYSNSLDSDKSSKGNYITKSTYIGNFGYSMRIKGLDKGINNNAQERLVVFHSDKKMKTKWSNGCFATSEDINKKIIDLTKNGVLVSVINK